MSPAKILWGNIPLARLPLLLASRHSMCRHVRTGIVHLRVSVRSLPSGAACAQMFGKDKELAESLDGEVRADVEAAARLLSKRVAAGCAPAVWSWQSLFRC